MIHDTIKQRLRAALLLSPPAKLAHASALRYAASLQADGTWSDVPIPPFSLLDPGKPSHLERTLLIAKALRPAAGALDDPLGLALDFWLSNDFTSADQHDNQILIPRFIGEIALLADQGLSAGAAGKVAEILARSRWANWVAKVGWVEHSGIDLLDIAYNHLLRGCLENAPSFFDAAFERIFGEVRLAKPGAGGIRADMTFLASENESAGSGFAFMRACARFIALAHGTPWQAPAETVKLLARFVLDGQQWMMRQETIDTEPPNDVFTETASLDELATAIQQLAQSGNPPRRLELAAFAHRLQGRGESLSGHRYLWQARMSVHQRPAFYASVRLGVLGSELPGIASSPIADGQTYFLRAGCEYRGVAFPAKLDGVPGTTTFLGDRPAPPKDRSGLRRLISGGVSEGDCGLAGTELQRPGLNAKKAWFFFDESVVCLGSGLCSQGTGYDVRTTLNHCRLQGPVVARFAGGERRLLAAEQEHTLTSVYAVEHDGLSYIFPDLARVVVRSSPNTGWSDEPAPPPDAFCLQVDHGTLPQGASYTYVVLPTDDDCETAKPLREEISRLEILSNSPSLQAVRHIDQGLLGLIFWEPGVVSLPGGGRVAANHACLLLCRDLPDGGTRLSIANPTGDAAAVHVEYGGQCVCFELAGGPDADRSVSRLL